MNFFIGIFCGIVFQFCISRYVDALCKDAGKRCNYECSACDIPCAGRYCYFARQKVGDEEENCDHNPSDHCVDCD